MQEIILVQQELPIQEGGQIGRGQVSQGQARSGIYYKIAAALQRVFGWLSNRFTLHGPASVLQQNARAINFQKGIAAQTVGMVGHQRWVS